VVVATHAEEDEAEEKQVGAGPPCNQTSQSTERKLSKNTTSTVGQANKLPIMRLHQNTSSTRHLTEETMSPKHCKHWSRQIPKHENQHWSPAKWPTKQINIKTMNNSKWSTKL